MTHYTERTQCIFCDCDCFHTLWSTPKEISMGCYVIPDTSQECVFMPFQILECQACHTFQTKYLGDSKIIYDYNANAHGTIRSSMNEKFAAFVANNPRVSSIMEIGGGNGGLSELILEKRKDISYTIVDPTYSGSNENRTIVRSFFEDLPEESIQSDTIVMSHVFEHFYHPNQILALFQKQSCIQHIYLNMPDLMNYIRQDNYHVLNPEHIYYVENEFLMGMFEKYGFETHKYSFHENHSVFYEFSRMQNVHPPSYPLIQQTASEEVPLFFERIEERIQKINEVLEQHPEKPFYIWPCSMHTIYLFAMGLNPDKVTAILDNAPHKIGQYLYGSKKPCLSFQSILDGQEESIVLLNGGCYNSEIKKENYTHIQWIE